MIGLAVFLALAAALAAVAFFLQSRSARQLAAQRAAELDELKRAAESARADVQALRAESKERREEVGSLRAELAATKKKAFEQAEAAKKAGGATSLRAEIDKLTTRLAEARHEAAQSSERAKAAEVAVERQAKEVERLRAAAQRKPEPAPPPAPAPAPAPAAAPAPAGAPGVEPALLEAERERADRAESKLAETRKRMAELEKDLKNARGRLETEKRVYIVQKGELELAQDRYGELRRRHETLRKEHDELLDALRKAAQEDRRRASPEAKAGEHGNPAEGSAA